MAKKRRGAPATRSRIRPAILVASIVIAAAGAFGLYKYVTRPTPAVRHYLAGEDYLKQGVTSLAVKEFQAAVSIDHPYADPYLAMSQIEQQNGNMAAAADLLGTVLYYHPTYPHIQCRRAQLYGMANRFETAYIIGRDAVKVEPNCATAHNSLGMVLEQAGDIDGAVAELGKAHVLDPKDEALTLDYARLLALSGKPDDALAIVDAVLHKTREFQTPANYLEGWILCEYGKAGRLELADGISHLALALVNSPHHAASHTELGRVFLRQRKYDQAQKELESALKEGPATLDLLAAMVELYKVKDAGLERDAVATEARYREAMLPLRGMRLKYTRNPSDLDNLTNLAYAEVAVGNVYDAFDLVREVISKEPGNKRAVELYNEMKSPPATRASSTSTKRAATP